MQFYYSHDIIKVERCIDKFSSNISNRAEGLINFLMHNQSYVGFYSLYKAVQKLFNPILIVSIYEVTSGGLVINSHTSNTYIPSSNTYIPSELTCQESVLAQRSSVDHSGLELVSQIWIRSNYILVTTCPSKTAAKYLPKIELQTGIKYVPLKYTLEKLIDSSL